MTERVTTVVIRENGDKEGYSSLVGQLGEMFSCPQKDKVEVSAMSKWDEMSRVEALEDLLDENGINYEETF